MVSQKLVQAMLCKAGLSELLATKSFNFESISGQSYATLTQGAANEGYGILIDYEIQNHTSTRYFECADNNTDTRNIYFKINGGGYDKGQIIQNFDSLPYNYKVLYVGEYSAGCYVTGHITVYLLKNKSNKNMVKGKPRELKTIGNKATTTIFGVHIDDSRVTQD